MSSSEYLIKELIKIVKNKNTTEPVKIKSLECLFLLIENKNNEVKINNATSTDSKEISTNEISTKAMSKESTKAINKGGFMSELQEKLKSRKDKI